MGLKSFHLVFIVAACLLASFFGVWSIKTYSEEESRVFLVLGALSFLSGLSLVGYLGWFLRKSKGLGYFALPLGLLCPRMVEACAVCVGDPNSPLTLSARTGVLFLLGLVSLLLASFALIFLCWARRARRLTA